MKDFNEKFNELNELLEFCKGIEDEDSENYVEEISKDTEAFKQALELVESRKKLLENTNEEDIKEISSTIEKNEAAMQLVYEKYLYAITLMAEEKAKVSAPRAAASHLSFNIRRNQHIPK